MTTMKEAVAIAIEHVRELFGDEIPGQPRLEEVERSGADWLVTLSFLREEQASRGDPLSAIATAVMPSVTNYVREYKEVSVETDTGEVQSVRIKKV